MYKIELSRDDLQLVRWAIQVAGDALAMSDTKLMSPEEIMGMIALLENADETIMKQIKDQLPPDSQLTLF